MAEENIQTKTTVGWLEMTNYTADPVPSGDSTKRGLVFINGSLYYWNGTAFAALSGGSGISTWDSLYDLDKSLTIDSDTLTFALTHATGNGLTITGSAATAGNLLVFSNSGSGNDVYGTSGTWYVSAAGAITATALTMGDDEPITLGASSDAVIQWVGASSVLDIAGATNFDGNMTINFSCQ